MRVAVLAALVLAGIGVASTLAHGGERRNAYVVHHVVSDEQRRAPRVDRRLVNAWGLAASPTGPWWTGNEASETSTLYSGEGRKQLLTVSVAGGPTGVAYYGGKQLRVSAGRASDPARFVYACEDGMLRAWTPTVPAGWSTQAFVVVDAAADAAVFRAVAIDGDRVYATDFHNGRVDVYDAHWRRIRRAGAFVDSSIPEWYAPFGIRAIGGHLFVTYVWRAPVNGNDAPTGGYVDEFDRNGVLLAHVEQKGPLNAPWGLALAPRSFGRFGGDLLVGNFGDGQINAYRRTDAGWAWDGTMHDRHGQPIVVNGLWSLAFGNGGTAGPANTLFFTAGPHQWRGETELGVHGLLGSIAAL
ncbi:MAG: hypothetical protein QOH95_262 [Gaiellaceae bacterium]|nr:hypothetical protein [Gaiellaceae bacterium]